MEDLIYKGIKFIQPDFDNIPKNSKKTKEAILSGQLIKKPCEVCSNTNVHPHHEIYSDYLNVRWLCRSCHSTIHGLLKGLREKEEIDLNRLIIWSELSRELTGGDRGTIRPNAIPKKHQKKVQELLRLLAEWKNEIDNGID